MAFGSNGVLFETGISHPAKTVNKDVRGDIYEVQNLAECADIIAGTLSDTTSGRKSTIRLIQNNTAAALTAGQSVVSEEAGPRWSIAALTGVEEVSDGYVDPTIPTTGILVGEYGYIVISGPAKGITDGVATFDYNERAVTAAVGEITPVAAILVVAENVATSATADAAHAGAQGTLFNINVHNIL